MGTVRRRKILQRSTAMEALMRQEVEKVVSDHQAATGIYDGIICVMHTRNADGGVVFCYIPKPLERLLEYCLLISRGRRQTPLNLVVRATTTRIISEI
jgi:hypothetical protein